MSDFQFNKFLLFGDSITEFTFNQFPLNNKGEPPKEPIFTLGSALSNAYTRKLQVVQRGFGGYNSVHGKKLLPKILEQEHDNVQDGEKIKLAYIFFGSNDSRLSGSNKDNNQHVPLDQYVANIKSNVEECTKRGIKVIVITPAIHSQTAWNVKHPEDLQTGDYRSTELFGQYAQALVKLGSEVGVPVVNLNEIFVKSGKSEDELLIDGLHLNGAGYQLFYDALMDTIKTNWPELHPDNLPFKFPYFADLTYETEF
ncbi:unnamed protein product [Ambrosiozyma monospora]|uniref:Unnamed protein product n=1 Tax=Ambrosiozyma monospora TaxID=43982 RepID=A0A9W7DKL5_AMBMO|nr:unnamed protein product [Ambrosiozyma monospora]